MTFAYLTGEGGFMPKSLYENCDHEWTWMDNQAQMNAIIGSDVGGRWRSCKKCCTMEAIVERDENVPTTVNEYVQYIKPEESPPNTFKVGGPGFIPDVEKCRNAPQVSVTVRQKDGTFKTFTSTSKPPEPKEPTNE